MKQLTRIVLLLLVLCMTSSLLLACNNDKTPENTDPQGTTPPPSSGDQLPQEALDYLPEIRDLGNYEYRMLIGYNEGMDECQYFYSADGLSGDAVSQALYERNTYVEEAFNCIITPVYSTITGDERNCYWIQPFIDANDDLWDVTHIYAGDAFQKNVPRGDYLDLSQLPNFNLDASYWDQAVQEDFCVDGMIFALEGDHTILDELETMAFFYNGKIYEEWNYNNTYGSPYSLVEANEWTFDVMLEMFKDTSKKSNGETLTENDVWGMISAPETAYTCFVGGNLKPLVVENGETVVKMKDTTTFNIMFEVLLDCMKRLYENNPENLIQGTPEANAIMTTKTGLEMFMADQALFLQAKIGEGVNLRDMESPFGILPIPQYYEDQTEYYCQCRNYSCPLMIPKTVATHDNIEVVTFLAEIITYYSRYAQNGALSLYDAFYEKMSVAKLCRTPDDYKMMELIYYSKTYDFDQTTGITRLYHMTHYLQLDKQLYYGYGATGSSGLYTFKPSMTTFRSNMQSLKDKAQEAVDQYLDQVHQNVIVLE